MALWKSNSTVLFVAEKEVRNDFCIFRKNEKDKVLTGLWQYDYGRVLRIQGLALPTATEIHFSLQESGGTAVIRVGTTKEGIVFGDLQDVIITPKGIEYLFENSLLEKAKKH